MTHEANAFSLLEIRVILFVSWPCPSFSMYRHIHKPTYMPTISQGYITSCCLLKVYFILSAVTDRDVGQGLDGKLKKKLLHD